jgi:hypothetical protein
MPRKLKITLWVAIGLLVATLAVIYVGYWAAIGVLAVPIPSVVTVKGTTVYAFMIMYGLIFACGIPIVYWTQKTITPVALRRYLLLAGASAMGMLFFGVPVHMLTEAGFVMAMLVCPIALVVGVVMALRFKSTPAS